MSDYIAKIERDTKQRTRVREFLDKFKFESVGHAYIGINSTQGNAVQLDQGWILTFSKQNMGFLQTNGDLEMFYCPVLGCKQISGGGSFCTQHPFELNAEQYDVLKVVNEEAAEELTPFVEDVCKVSFYEYGEESEGGDKAVTLPSVGQTSKTSPLMNTSDNVQLDIISRHRCTSPPRDESPPRNADDVDENESIDSDTDNEVDVQPVAKKPKVNRESVVGNSRHLMSVICDILTGDDDYTKMENYTKVIHALHDRGGEGFYSREHNVLIKLTNLPFIQLIFRGLRNNGNRYHCLVPTCSSLASLQRLCHRLGSAVQGSLCYPGLCDSDECLQIGKEMVDAWTVLLKRKDYGSNKAYPMLANKFNIPSEVIKEVRARKATSAQKAKSKSRHPMIK